MPKIKIKHAVKKDPDKLMNSMYDTPFKAIIQHPKFRRLLSLIISEMTIFSPKFIYDNLIFVNTELPIDNVQERKKITDILIKISGSTINIEANRFLTKSSRGKNRLYHHKVAFEQYMTGDEIDEADIIQINFNTVIRYGDKLFMKFTLQSEDGKYTDEENFKRFHVNMANPLEKYYTNGKEALSKIEKVLVMFQLTSLKELREIAKGDEDLENMAKIIEDLNSDPNIIGLYDKEEMDEWMKKVDRKEALKEGLEQGSSDKAKEIALNMLNAGMNVTEISKFTGLSEKDIEKIKSEEN